MFNKLSSKLTASILFLTAVFQLSGSPLQEGQKLVASDSSLNGFFGWSTDIDGDTAVVGTLNQEAVYVYNRVGSTWTQVQKITSVNAVNFDDFGFSLSLDGQRLLIGSPEKRSSNNFFDVGTAYIFELVGGQWVETHQFLAPVSRGGGSNQFGEDFGYSVSLEGNRAVIGAPNTNNQGNTGNTPSGSVYAYEYDGTQWSQIGHLFASDTTARNHFGWDVKLSGDRIYVGAPRGTGAVYEYIYDGLNWLESQKITPLDPPTFGFGNNLDVDSNVLIIGASLDASVATRAGAAFVLEPDQDDNWVQTQELFSSDIMANDLFGNDVDIQGDNLLITSLEGRAYLFQKRANGWQEAKIITPSEDITDDVFGASGAIGDGLIMVGSTRSENGMDLDHGAVFTFVNDLIFNDSFD